MFGVRENDYPWTIGANFLVWCQNSMGMAEFIDCWPEMEKPDRNDSTKIYHHYFYKWNTIYDRNIATFYNYLSQSDRRRLYSYYKINK